MPSNSLLSSNRRLLKTALLVTVGIALGFPSRLALNALMSAVPQYATIVDVFGQFVFCLLIVWFCLLPIFEMYGVIKEKE